MTDKAKAPVQNDDAPSGVEDGAANSAFLADMIGDRGGLSMDDAVEAIAGSDLLDAFIKNEEPKDNRRQGDDGDDQPAREASEEQDDESSDEVDDDPDADQDGQGDDEPPVEESEDQGGAELLTRDENGKLKKLDLDDIEVPFELDGEEQFMTLAEVQQELKDNRLRRDDYTRKTQELGQRVAQEVERRTAERQAELDQGYERLNVLHGIIGDHLVRDVSYHDVLKAVGGNHEKAGKEMERLQRQRSAYQEAVQAMEKRESELSQANVRETLSSVRQSVSEWRDQRVFQRDLGKLEEFFRTQGFDDSDIVAVFQKPSYLLMAKKAFEFDKMSKVRSQKKRGEKAIRLGQSKAPAADKKNTQPRRPRRTQRARGDMWSQLNGATVGLSQEEAIDQIAKSLG